MKYNIITISREFGSGGRYIGEETAKKLHIPYYDKEIISKVASETGFAEDFVRQAGEYSPFKSIFSYGFVNRDSGGESIEDYVYSVQRKIILDLAEKSPCVIVGRCADYILKDRQDCLNVFIHGNTQDKIKRIMKYKSVDEKSARKLMKDTDKRRSVNYNYYTDMQWGKVQNYDICLNSTSIGTDSCAEIILNAVKNL
ncbi:MAG: cytidylate kinase-like family protein [Clostridiales bacterium]|nr:cytidylate kinase-like family protein [Clostridiales bacterium]